jgi:hypothetical protein
MMGPAVFLLIVVLVAGAIVAHLAAFTQLGSLRTKLTLLEREREKDRELLEAVLLEDTAKLRRLMGTRE